MTATDPMHSLAVVIVAGFILFLFGLAGTSTFAPQRAKEFLRAFASSAGTHYAEQAIRLVVGAAIVVCAPGSRIPMLMTVFGWAILISTFGLLLIPWRWHHAFATRVMPPLLQQLGLFALAAFVLAVAILYAMWPQIRSTASFISFTTRRGAHVIVAIKEATSAPLALPNVARNVIAHELGHALGMRHNADSTLLMCGRPASCRPGAFESMEPRFFPLSSEEREVLRRQYADVRVSEFQRSQ